MDVKCWNGRPALTFAAAGFRVSLLGGRLTARPTIGWEIGPNIWNAKSY